MKKENTKYGVICSICIVGFVLIGINLGMDGGTDMIMPAAYIIEGMTTWYIMLLGLIAEAAVVKWLLKETYLKSAAITLSVNLVSIVLDCVALFIIGLIVEVLFIFINTATFHISHWIVNFLLIIPFNAALEGLVAKWGFKLKFKKLFPGFCLANAASIMICILLNLIWVAHMYI